MLFICCLSCLQMLRISYLALSYWELQCGCFHDKIGERWKKLMLQGHGPAKTSVSLKAAFSGLPGNSSNWLNILLSMRTWYAVSSCWWCTYSSRIRRTAACVSGVIHPRNWGILQQCTFMWEHLYGCCADLQNAWQQDATIKQGGKEVRRGEGLKCIFGAV